MSGLRHEGPPVGLALASATPPERIRQVAPLAEALGFAELWFAEDCFLSGGIAAAATALSLTERIPVGLGVVPAMTRHPALLAMELATLERVHPGRLRPGVGLGVPAWLEQMGLRPRSMLTAMRECVGALRTLLAGQEVALEGRCFRLDAIRLDHPPAVAPPIYMGVVGPKALALSAEIADGNVLSVLTGVDYLTQTRARLAAAAPAGADLTQRPLATLAICCADRDARAAKAEARRTMSFFLAAGGPDALTDAYGISDELRDMVQRGGREVVEREMPDRWVDDLAVAGTPDECAERLRRLLDAGAGTVVLAPTRGDEAQLRLISDEVLSRL